MVFYPFFVSFIEGYGCMWISTHAIRVICGISVNKRFMINRVLSICDFQFQEA